jgi:hypothetical protein
LDMKERGENTRDRKEAPESWLVRLTVIDGRKQKSFSSNTPLTEDGNDKLFRLGHKQTKTPLFFVRLETQTEVMDHSPAATTRGQRIMTNEISALIYLSHTSFRQTEIDKQRQRVIEAETQSERKRETESEREG